MTKSEQSLRERRICRKCCIIFDNLKACPRCGKGDKIEVYFELVSVPGF
ncbi:MAG: hypothetical protein JW754_02135 [Candidatus Aenigmarchaeota archaeon]|nr:hypothetical protein [Candidatus Aenigmarchaeota archaeon]